MRTDRVELRVLHLAPFIPARKSELQILIVILHSLNRMVCRTHGTAVG